MRHSRKAKARREGKSPGRRCKLPSNNEEEETEKGVARKRLLLVTDTVKEKRA